MNHQDTMIINMGAFLMKHGQNNKTLLYQKTGVNKHNDHMSKESMLKQHSSPNSILQ